VTLSLYICVKKRLFRWIAKVMHWGGNIGRLPYLRKPVGPVFCCPGLALLALACIWLCCQRVMLSLVGEVCGASLG